MSEQKNIPLNKDSAKRFLIKRLIHIVVYLSVAITVVAQHSYIDSLKSETGISKNDTDRLVLLGSIAYYYAELNPDSAYRYSERMLQLAKNLNLQLEEAFALGEMGYALINMGNYPRSLQTLLSAVAITEDPGSEKNILSEKYPAIDVYLDRTVSIRLQRITKLGRTFQYLGILYSNAGNHIKAKYYFKETIRLAGHANNLRILSIAYTTLGRTYLSLNQKDSALWSAQKAEEYAMKAGFHKYMGSILLNRGRVYMALGRPQAARESFLKALEASTEQKYYRGIVASNLVLSDMYKQSGNKDSVLYFIDKGLVVANYLNAPDLLLRLYKALADFYKAGGNSDSTVKYQSLIIKINDSLFNSKQQVQQFQNIDFDEQQRQQQIEVAQAEYRSKMRTNVLLAGLAIFLFIAIMFWRNSRQRKKANILLSQQKNELEQALASLKTTQVQLIQSEKMASLGELTAGIAHEIQNPLNFVNNFSEVNTELADELKYELAMGNTQSAIEIADSIKENEEKINQHGKRADAIVKGMLQHSRSSTGQKELTDINALCDEYLRLAFHGFKAKDKSFNAKFDTDFDPTIGKINVVPQEIGRVVLNLINNAFYAISEKQNIAGHEPTVTVSTKKIVNKIEIKVKDNGNGIPQKVLDKIFQPFFTTKPTGEGTGLGLSLSYDIITKGHGGELKVETKEGEGSVFIIQLPI